MGLVNYNTFSGKTHTEETKQKMREKASKRKPEQNSQHGTCWITDGSENKKIKKTDDLPEGGSYGRKIKPSAGKRSDGNRIDSTSMGSGMNE